MNMIWTRTTVGFVALCLVWTLTACGQGAEPTPTATPSPIPTATANSAPTATPPAPAPGAPENAPAAAGTPGELAVEIPTVQVEPAAPAVLATPTVSVLEVIEANRACAVEYDLDLAGYPDLTGQMGCALSEANYDPVGINEFGAGPDYNRFMLWFGSEGQIYVLFPDQTWQAYEDTWADGQPELSCNPLNVAAASPPLPRRGFGKLWCTVDGLQQKLGAIEREERLCQHTVVQRFERGRLLACFEDATIRYFRLLDDGSWDMIMVQ
jgi:hypothetical protein